MDRQGLEFSRLRHDCGLAAPAGRRPWSNTPEPALGLDPRDADHSRITQKETAGSAVTTTTYLNGPGVSSEKVVTGSVTTWTDYLMAGGARVGARSMVVGGATSLRYYITDHLGSVGRERAASDGRWLRRLRRHVAAEQGLGLLVLALVGVLGRLEPPIHA